MSKVGLQLHGGDDRLFQLLFMFSVMTVDQIRRTRYYQPDTGRLSSRDNVIKRLCRLRSAGYLRSEDVYTPERRRTQVYRLGKAALAELHLTNPLISQSRLYEPAERTAHQMLHSLMVTECAVRVIESLRGSEPPVHTPNIGHLDLPFYHSRVVSDPTERSSLSRYATHRRIHFRGADQTIRPDLTFALQRDGAARLFFLEADRGTEGYRQLEEKIRAFDAFDRYHGDNPPSEPLCREYAPEIRDVRVLFVTTTPRRIEGIVGKLQDVPGLDMVRFSTIDLIGNANMVFDAPWYLLDGDGMTQDTLMKMKGTCA